MTYDAIEISVRDAQPVELYTFTRGPEVFRFTTAQETHLFAGQTYTAFPIQRSKIEATQDVSRNPINFSADRSLPFVQQYISAPPTDIIDVTIQRFHVTDVAQEAVVFWLGRVVNVKFKADEVQIRSEPIFTALKRPALRRLYQANCPHLLYGPVCTVNRSLFLVNAVITQVSGITLDAVAFGSQVDGYFTGGLIEWTNNGLINKRFVTDHVGQQITINLPFAGIQVTDSVEIFPGCDHTLATCVAKFANELNYGGFPYIPVKNPFAGVSVF